MKLEEIENLAVGNILFYMWEGRHRKEYVVFYIDLICSSRSVYLRERFQSAFADDEYYLHDYIYKLEADGMYDGDRQMLYIEELSLDTETMHLPISSTSTTTLSSIFQKLADL